MAPYEVTIEEVFGGLQHSGKKVTLLTGAGCSRSAGIPTAPELIAESTEKFPEMVRNRSPKNYAEYMAFLPPGVRHHLIAEHMDTAKINWTHLAIAQLMKSKKVDRVLTVNFDPLIVRACAMVGLYPAVCDFAESKTFNPSLIPEHSVFYLTAREMVLPL
jgi:NAD-dependent SIR2 family protein deacetylase